MLAKCYVTNVTVHVDYMRRIKLFYHDLKWPWMPLSKYFRSSFIDSHICCTNRRHCCWPCAQSLIPPHCVLIEFINTQHSFTTLIRHYQRRRRPSALYFFCYEWMNEWTVAFFPRNFRCHVIKLEARWTVFSQCNKNRCHRHPVTVTRRLTRCVMHWLSTTKKRWRPDDKW